MIMVGTKQVSSAVAAALLSSMVGPTMAQAATVTVKSGDTLQAIAAANKTTVAELVKQNKIQNPNLIYPGQQIETDTEETTQTASVQKVTLQQGDTIWGLAQKYGVSMQSIATANHMSSIYGMIHPGQVLTIPDAKTAAQTATQPQTQTTQSSTAATARQNAQTTTQQSASTATAQNNGSAQTYTQQSGQSQGTFKLSFYDPAVLGSNMGYGGVAANLSVFPKGTQLKITLSDGTVWYRTVNDTGTFAYSNPRQLDVAMPNSQIPSAGILYGSVEVLN